MEYDHKTTGLVIGRLRVQHGMSQEALSERAQIARSHLGMLETGRKSATVETLWRIAGAFEMRLSDLIRLVEEEIGA